MIQETYEALRLEPDLKPVSPGATGYGGNWYDRRLTPEQEDWVRRYEAEQREYERQWAEEHSKL